MAGRAAYDQFKNAQEEDAQQKHRASARTALRTMLVYGLPSRFSRPDDEELIWRGDLQWRHSDGRELGCEEFDWLIDYLEDSAKTDDDTEGDALLALSGMRGLGSSTNRRSYISSLIRCMAFTRSSRVQHNALRAIFEAREELASITSVSMPQGVDAQLLNELSCGILTAVSPNSDQAIHTTGSNTSSHLDGDSCYVHLIFSLTKNDEWCERLTHDGHSNRCISLVDRVYRDRYSKLAFYLLVILGRTKSLDKDLPFSAAEERWRLLITTAWDCAQSSLQEHGVVDGIPVIVTGTRLNLTVSDDGVPKEWFADLAAKVHCASLNLQERQVILVDGGIAQAAIDAALSSMQGLYEDLNRLVKQRDDVTSQSIPMHRSLPHAHYDSSPAVCGTSEDGRD
ncbi:hypothetical protein BD769DRAFT_1507318 [Suillus cothurnatus]|nr:hypothetical protein BD769DRAFT_1507318 [Suillus cothurnatus]